MASCWSKQSEWAKEMHPATICCCTRRSKAYLKDWREAAKIQLEVQCFSLLPAWAKSTPKPLNDKTSLLLSPAKANPVHSVRWINNLSVIKNINPQIEEMKLTSVYLKQHSNPPTRLNRWSTHRHCGKLWVWRVVLGLLAICYFSCIVQN